MEVLIPTGALGFSTFCTQPSTTCGDFEIFTYVQCSWMMILFFKCWQLVIIRFFSQGLSCAATEGGTAWVVVLRADCVFLGPETVLPEGSPFKTLTSRLGNSKPVGPEGVWEGRMAPASRSITSTDSWLSAGTVSGGCWGGGPMCGTGSPPGSRWF